MTSLQVPIFGPPAVLSDYMKTKFGIKNWENSSLAFFANTVDVSTSFIK